MECSLHATNFLLKLKYEIASDQETLSVMLSNISECFIFFCSSLEVIFNVSDKGHRFLYRELIIALLCSLALKLSQRKPPAPCIKYTSLHLSGREFSVWEQQMQKEERNIWPVLVLPPLPLLPCDCSLSCIYIFKSIRIMVYQPQNASQGLQTCQFLPCSVYYFMVFAQKDATCFMSPYLAGKPSGLFLLFHN